MKLLARHWLWLSLVAASSIFSGCLVDLEVGAAGGSPSSDGGGGTGGGGSPTSGAGAETSTAGGNGGDAPAVEPGPWKLTFPGKPARWPLASDQDGHVWLLGGDYEEFDSPWSEEWHSARLRKLSPDGLVELDSTLAGQGLEVEPRSIAVDLAGNVIFTCVVTREAGGAPSIVVGGTTVSLPYPETMLLAKLGPDGGLLWSRRFKSHEVHANVAVDMASQIYVPVWVWAESPGDFGGGPLVPIDNDDLFVVIFSPDGQYLGDHRLVARGGSEHLLVEPTGAFSFISGAAYGGLEVERHDPSGQLVYHFEDPFEYMEGLVSASDGEGGLLVAWMGSDQGTGVHDLITTRFDGSGQITWQTNEGYGQLSQLAPAAGRLFRGISWPGSPIILEEIGKDGSVLSSTEHGGGVLYAMAPHLANGLISVLDSGEEMFVERVVP